MRMVEPGDTPRRARDQIEPAIEVANIFKLGTRYCEPLGATYLDEDGKEKPIVMGSYGIGPARIVAAAVEQLGDEDGIAGPLRSLPGRSTWSSLAQGRGPRARELRTSCTRELCASRASRCIYDDRDAGPGQKLTDAELLGCPLRVVVGRRGLADGSYRGLGAARRREAARAVEGAGEPGFRGHLFA